MELKGLRKIEKPGEQKQAHGAGCTCPSCTKKDDAIKKILENQPKPTEPNQGKQTGCPPGCSCSSCVKKADSIDKILGQIGKSKEAGERQKEVAEPVKIELVKQELILRITNQMNQGTNNNQSAPVAQIAISQSIENNGSSIHLRRIREGTGKGIYIKPVVRGSEEKERRRIDEKPAESTTLRTNQSQEVVVSLPIDEKTVTAAKQEEIALVTVNGAEGKQEEVAKGRKNKREIVQSVNQEVQERTVPIRLEELSTRQISMIINTMLQLEIAEKHQENRKIKIKSQEINEQQKDTIRSQNQKKKENKQETVAANEEREKAEKTTQTKTREVVKAGKREKIKAEKSIQNDRKLRAKEIKILEKQAVQIIKNLEKNTIKITALKTKKTKETVAEKQKIDKLISNKIQELIKIRKQIRDAKKLKNQKAIKKHIKNIKKIIEEIKRKRIILALLTKNKKSKLKKIIRNLLGALKKLLEGS